MENKRVVITGLGIISSLGKEPEEFFKKFLDETSKGSLRIEGFDPIAILGLGSSIRTLDKCSIFGLCAAKKALDSAGINLAELDLWDIGISLGTLGGVFSGLDFYRTKLLESPRYVNPAQFPNTVVNATASQIAIRYKITGFNTTIATGSSAGLDAIIYAVQMIKKLKAKIVLCGGVEEYSDEVSFAFNLAKNEDLSEGAAIFALEELDFALKRNAKILAEIKDFSQVMQNSRPVIPNAEKIKELVSRLKPGANVEDSKIDCFFAQSKEDKDILKGLFKDAKYYLLKDKLGNLHSASSAFSALAATLLITNNLNKNILINSFDCAGHYSSLVISKFNE